MKHRAILTILLLLKLIQAEAQIQIDKTRFEIMLANKEYKQLFTEANQIYRSPYGKTSYLLHYYIGRSLCGRGFITQGQSWYEHIQKKLKYPQDFESVLKIAMTDCKTSSQTSVKVVNTPIIKTSRLPAGVGGKGGFILDCNLSADEDYSNLEKNDTLAQRVFNIEDKVDAIVKLRTFLNADFKIDTSDKFIIVTKTNSYLNDRDIKKVTESLDDAYSFFVKFYGLEESNKVVTVYLVASRYELQQTAKIVHDIKLSSLNIGYSSLQDLSILGIANPQSSGTLIHELFHLLIRSKYGDISPWLDEGLACLYSVYELKQDSLIGYKNTWRVNHFRLLTAVKSQNIVQVPTLNSLTNFNWDKFDAVEEHNACQASVNYALANMFCLYLQEKRKIQKLMQFYDSTTTLKDDYTINSDDRVILEKAFGLNFYAIEKDFYDWLSKAYSINMNSLLEKRQQYNIYDVPEEFTDDFMKIDSLIKIAESSPDAKKREIKKIKEERNHLLYEMESAKRHFEREEGMLIDDVSNSNMNDEVGKSKIISDWNKKIDIYKEEIKTFIEKLNSVISSTE